MSVRQRILSEPRGSGTNRSVPWTGLTFVAALAAIAGCRNGGECSAEEHADLAGTWDVRMTVTSDSCDPGDVGDEETEVATVVQDGRDITVDLGIGVLEGTVCGNSFSARGSESGSFGGCVGSQTITVSGDFDGATITARSSYSSTTNGHEDCFGVGSCRGTYDITGERQ